MVYLLNKKSCVKQRITPHNRLGRFRSLAQTGLVEFEIAFHFLCASSLGLFFILCPASVVRGTLYEIGGLSF